MLVLRNDSVSYHPLPIVTLTAEFLSLSVVIFPSKAKIPTMSSSRNSSQPSKTGKKQQFAVSFKPENFIPGLVIGFILGFFFDLAKPIKNGSGISRSINPTSSKKRNGDLVGKELQLLPSNSKDEDLKMVLVVRQDLKMGTGKIASQCAHAATGLYSELTNSHRYLLSRWELCGQAKIVVACRNQQEMNKLRETADSIGLPTYVVADAGRTQVAAGSNTVLAIGPGKKSMVDSVTGKQRLL